MASGRLGSSTPAATTWTAVYTVPAAKLATCNVSVANRNSTAVTIRLAVSTATTPSNGEYLAYDYTLTGTGSAGSLFQYTGLVLDASKIVTAYASSTGVDFNVFGLET